MNCKTCRHFSFFSNSVADDQKNALIMPYPVPGKTKYDIFKVFQKVCVCFFGHLSILSDTFLKIDHETGDK